MTESNSDDVGFKLSVAQREHDPRKRNDLVNNIIDCLMEGKCLSSSYRIC